MILDDKNKGFHKPYGRITNADIYRNLIVEEKDKRPLDEIKTLKDMEQHQRKNVLDYVVKNYKN